MFCLNKVKMKISKLCIAVFLVATLVALPLFVQSRMTYYTFEIIVPDEVNANPGEKLEVEGGILVTGMYWLHKFNLTVDGVPYDYKLEPAWWQDVRILREWNPKQGVYRVPEKFKITIDVPSDAKGAHLITLKGQEHHSFREVSNETYFILTIGGAPAKVNLSVSDIVVPEMIKDYEPFNLTFKLNNLGALDVASTVSVRIPEDWKTDKASITMRVKGSSSETGMFTITPTKEAGEVSLFVEYPFKGQIINFTKIGPYLVPGKELPTTTTTQPQPFYIPIANFVYSLASPLIKRFEAAAGIYTLPITIGVIIVLLIIIVWILAGMLRFVRAKGGRGEPESTKQIEATTATAAVGTTGVQVKEV